MFVLELHASDVHDVLGRLLDRTRVAGLRLSAVSAWAEAGEYRIRAAIDTADRVALAVRRDCSLAAPAGACTIQN